MCRLHRHLQEVRSRPVSKAQYSEIMQHRGCNNCNMACNLSAVTLEDHNQTGSRAGLIAEGYCPCYCFDAHACHGSVLHLLLFQALGQALAVSETCHPLSIMSICARKHPWPRHHHIAHRPHCQHLSSRSKCSPLQPRSELSRH